MPCACLCLGAGTARAPSPREALPTAGAGAGASRPLPPTPPAEDREAGHGNADAFDGVCAACTVTLPAPRRARAAPLCSSAPACDDAREPTHAQVLR